MTAFAQNATLAWLANNEPDLGGYYLYYKDSTDSLPLTKTRFTERINIGDTTSYKKTGLAPGKHSFALTAFDTSLNESGLSVVVTKTVSSSDAGAGSGSGSSDLGSAGGCGAISSKSGKPPGPGDSAGMLSLIFMMWVLLFIRKIGKKHRVLLHPAVS